LLTSESPILPVGGTAGTTGPTGPTGPAGPTGAGAVVAEYVGTLSADMVLSPTAAQLQRLTPVGATRQVILPNTPAMREFAISNTSTTQQLVLVGNDGATRDALAPLEAATVITTPVSTTVIRTSRTPWYKVFEDASGVKVGAGAAVGLERGNGRHRVWMELGPSKWAILRMDTGGTRLSWRGTSIVQVHAIYGPSTFTLSGVWTQLQSTTSGVIGAHVGNRAVQASAIGAFVSATVTGTGLYDVYIAYTGRSDGAQVRVDVDGVQAVVFPTYSATSNVRRKTVKVASGLSGTHTIKATATALGSPGGAVAIIEAITTTASIGDARTLPPAWTAATTYANGAEVASSGIYYRSSTAGVSGSVAPSHITGSAADGTVSWTAYSETTYFFVRDDVDYSSEREYAANITISGVTEDLGGNTHGGEALTSRSIKLDGTTWSETGAYGVITLGGAIDVVEQLAWSHASAATLATASLTRTIRPGTVNMSLDATFAAACSIGWLYTAMLPGVRWDGGLPGNVWTTAVTGDGTQININAYSGVAGNPVVAAGMNTSIALIGTLATGAGMMATRVAPSSVGNFARAGSGANFHPNVAGGTAAGGVDWQIKAYFERAGNIQEPFVVGQHLKIASEMVVA
jgi:hypothetical protein